jgi:hypothetical protein
VAGWIRSGTTAPGARQSVSRLFAGSRQRTQSSYRPQQEVWFVGGNIRDGQRGGPAPAYAPTAPRTRPGNSSRIRRNAARRCFSSPVAAGGSTRPQWIHRSVAGNTGQDSLRWCRPSPPRQTAGPQPRPLPSTGAPSAQSPTPSSPQSPTAATTLTASPCRTPQNGPAPRAGFAGPSTRIFGFIPTYRSFRIAVSK